MFHEATLVCETDLIESSYGDVRSEEFMRYKCCTAFQTAAVSLIKHGPDVPASKV